MSNITDLINQYWTDLYFLLHPAHQDKVSHQVIRILQLVEKSTTVTISDAAGFLNVSHNTASERVTRMIEKDLVEKQRDPADQRRVILKLTAKGTEILKRNTQLDENKLGQVLASLTEEEQQQIAAALQLLKECAASVYSR